MVAFYRSDGAFLTADQIYVKLLPNGEPVQLTHDPRLKYNLAFSPDGSRIAYTVLEDQLGWNSYTISSLGGDCRKLLPPGRTAGLTWLDDHRLLFSEIKMVPHMGVVTVDRESFRTCERSIFPTPPARHGALFLCLRRTANGC